MTFPLHAPQGSRKITRMRTRIHVPTSAAVGVISAVACLAGVACLAMPAAAAPEGSLVPGESFPDIAMPNAASGELQSIADFRGEKLMLQVFASW